MYIHTKSTYAILKFSGSLKSRTGTRTVRDFNFLKTRSNTFLDMCAKRPASHCNLPPEHILITTREKSEIEGRAQDGYSSSRRKKIYGAKEIEQAELFGGAGDCARAS